MYKAEASAARHDAATSGAADLESVQANSPTYHATHHHFRDNARQSMSDWRHVFIVQ